MQLKNIAIGVNHTSESEYKLSDPCFIHFTTPENEDVIHILRYLYENVDANYYGVMTMARYFNFNNAEKATLADCLNKSTEQRFNLFEGAISEQISNIALAVPVPSDVRKERMSQDLKKTLRNYLTTTLKNRFPNNSLAICERVIKNEYSNFSVAYDMVLSGWEYPRYLNFCMNKNTFYSYCNMLFRILTEVDKEIDVSKLSSVGREYREMIARILIAVFEKNIILKKSEVTKRLPVVGFRNVQEFCGFNPAFEKNNIPIFTVSSNLYVPYLSVWLQSILDASQEVYNYDIFVLEREISDRNKEILLQMIAGKPNCSLRFVNPEPMLDGVTLTISSPTVSIESFYRVFAPWLFQNYDKIIAMDCDIVVKTSLAELYNVDLADRLIGGVLDIVYEGLINADKNRYNYTIYDMGMSNPFHYINTGVLLMDLKGLRDKYDFQDVCDFCSNNVFKIQEQDAINALFENQIMHIDLKWNYYVNLNKWINNCLNNAFINYKKKYEQTVPQIIHYANNPKPWFDPAVPFAEEFWEVARKTPFYEAILYRMMEEQCKKLRKSIPILSPKPNKKVIVKEKLIKPVLKPILPVHSRRREYFKELYKKVLGRNNRLDWVKYFNRQYNNLTCQNIRSKIPWTFAHKNRKLLLSLKDSHKGERCFFVGLGPSLRIDDLEKLKGEITFAVNNVFSLFEQTDWRPTYYLNQETIAKNNDLIKTDLESRLSLCNFKLSFFPLNKQSGAMKSLVENVAFLPIVNDWCMYYGGKEEMRDFSTDCSKVVYAAYLSMYSLLQIAFYMGFREIYLIGCDAKYTVEKPHCYDKDGIDNWLLNTNKSVAIHSEGINKGFNAMRYGADRYGISIYNATRGGYLEIFPRVDFDSLDLKGESK